MTWPHFAFEKKRPIHRAHGLHVGTLLQKLEGPSSMQRISLTTWLSGQLTCSILRRVRSNVAALFPKLGISSAHVMGAGRKYRCV